MPGGASRKPPETAAGGAVRGPAGALAASAAQGPRPRAAMARRGARGFRPFAGGLPWRGSAPRSGRGCGAEDGRAAAPTTGCAAVPGRVARDTRSGISPAPHLSIGVEECPPIGVPKGSLWRCGEQARGGVAFQLAPPTQARVSDGVQARVLMRQPSLPVSTMSR